MPEVSQIMADETIGTSEIEFDMEDESPKKKPDPTLVEIEELFDMFTESDMLMSSYREHNEMVASNLLVAYALLKTRKVSIFTRIKRWLRRNKNGRRDSTE